MIFVQTTSWIHLLWIVLNYILFKYNRAFQNEIDYWNSIINIFNRNKLQVIKHYSPIVYSYEYMKILFGGLRSRKSSTYRYFSFTIVSGASVIKYLELGVKIVSIIALTRVKNTCVRVKIYYVYKCLLFHCREDDLIKTETFPKRKIVVLDFLDLNYNYFIILSIFLQFLYFKL